MIAIFIPFAWNALECILLNYKLKCLIIQYNSDWGCLIIKFFFIYREILLPTASKVHHASGTPALSERT